MLLLVSIRPAKRSGTTRPTDCLCNWWSSSPERSLRRAYRDHNTSRYILFADNFWSRYGGQAPPTRPTAYFCYFDFSQTFSSPAVEAIPDRHLSMLLSSPCSSFVLASREHRHPQLCHILRHKQVPLAVFLMYILSLCPIDVERSASQDSLLSQHNTNHRHI